MLRELSALLSPYQRGKFLQLVSEHLSGIEIGDGVVHQAGIAAQRKLLSADREVLR